jgi:hypothetical protein
MSTANAWASNNTTGAWSWPLTLTQRRSKKKCVELYLLSPIRFGNVYTNKFVITPDLKFVILEKEMSEPPTFISYV